MVKKESFIVDNSDELKKFQFQKKSNPYLMISAGLSPFNFRFADLIFSLGYHAWSV
jgi:hypothetical protein